MDPVSIYNSSDKRSQNDVAKKIYLTESCRDVLDCTHIEIVKSGQHDDEYRPYVS